MGKKEEFRKGDYELEKIPQENRKSLIALIFIYVGYGMNSSEILSGGTITNALGVSKGLTAIYISIGILCCIGALSSYAAAKTGLTFSLLTRYVFGTLGTKIPSVVLAAVHFCWFGVLTAVAATFIHEVFGFNLILVSIVLGLLIAASAVLGVKALTVSGYLAVPTILVVAVMGTVSLFNAEYNGFAPGDGSMTFLTGISTGVGAFICGATLIADVTRFSRTPGQAVVGAIIGVSVGLLVMRTLGAFSIGITGEADIVLAFIRMGLPVGGFIFLLLNVWTTNDTILYSSGLAFSNVFKIDRLRITIIIGILGTIVAVSGIYNHFGAWLNFLATGIPPISGVVFADFYLLHKQKYVNLESLKNKWNPVAFIAWFGAVGIAMIHVGIPAVNGLVSAAIIYLVIMRILKTAKPDYYAQLTHGYAEDDLEQIVE